MGRRVRLGLAGLGPMGRLHAENLSRSRSIELVRGVDAPDETARVGAGELGHVHLFRTSLRDKRPPSIEYVAGAGGFFADVTIHDLDTARWMVGEIDEVTAVGAVLSDPGYADLGDIDHAVVALRFASGALGVIDNSRAAGYGYE